MKQSEYQPPFPYFGGKSSVADIIWEALGDVGNYVEPFFGSGAVLFLRPTPGQIETVNDADGFVANFWRAMKQDSDAVADHADWPVNEADLHARHLWLIGQRERITERLMGDADWFDAKAAGWWCWGLCCWIVGGWCTGKGPWQSQDGVLVDSRVTGDAGRGVNRKLPHLGDAGRGVNRTRPHLGNAGQGVNRPSEGNRREALKAYLRQFRDRLERVRVCCGDWRRVCTHVVTTNHGATGIFLDPPYADTANRDPNCYAVDSLTVAHDVREWAIENGRNPLMRIVLAGYEGEHQMPDDWRVVEWKAQGGYGNQGDVETRGKANAHKERLWLSPACLQDTGLFNSASGPVRV